MVVMNKIITFIPNFSSNMNIFLHRHHLKWLHGILSFSFLLGLCLKCIISIILMFPVLIYTLISNTDVYGYMLRTQCLWKDSY